MREIGEWFGLAKAAHGARHVSVLGCPYDGSATGRTGSAAGPDAIRHWARTEEGIDERGRPVVGVVVDDLGNVDVTGTAPLAAIRAGADRALGHGSTTLLGLGGDHAVTVPLAAAVAAHHGEMAFVMLDAHADCFPEYEGDPESHACTVARLWEIGACQPEHTALIGLRSYATPELELIARAGLVVPAAAWSADNAQSIAERIFGVAAGLPVYLSIDIDVLDPAAAPGTGYPVAGGPSSRQLLDLLTLLLADADVVGVDLVEVAPDLDASGITAASAAHILLQVLAGLGRRGSQEPAGG